MSKRWLTILLLLSVSINLGVIGALGLRTWNEESRVSKGSKRQGKKGYPGLAELNLTEEQSQRLDETRKEFKREMERVRQLLSAERKVLFDLLHEDKLSKEKVMEQVEKIGALHRETEKMVMNHLLEKQEYLTHQQWEQFLGLISGRLPGCKRGMHMDKPPKGDKDNRVEQDMHMRRKGSENEKGIAPKAPR